jgi:ketosteroid isomerase-like protein
MPVNRTVVEAFYRAFASRDPAEIARFIDDDAKWVTVGPIDLLQFCGERHGKKAILDLFQRVGPACLEITSLVPEIMLVDSDRAATLSRLTGRQGATGRIISYRCAQFLEFRRDKVIDFRSLIDSFDAAEQMLGHHIDLHVPATAPAL